jgi:hypothetical protein
MLEIEQGDPVFLQKYVSIDQLPLSFRYYDQIINMIQFRFKLDRREYFGLDRVITNIFDEMSTVHKMKVMMGIIGPNKLYHSNTNKLKEIDHHESNHTMML